ncbi:hypothetical protein CNMCM8927_009454 [Aspergillus lentulus]|uniref:Uncharacterized protein n=1 Tax=Aspergillus lentulus TaxID=293939 RepID=A0AAN5YJT5_ASPLE|nr:hypothetical protein CNMCM6069_003880 [Aspergillus lentulus]KAF4182312.1 hypothetical protein CNMCM7927_000067 [Aspergillus lentulus]KAF4202864.1 hypothetical protein CNMCM8927_009454 [Aspergillus lentulus]
MSRNFIPAALAIGVGILTGMTLQPFELLNPQTYDWISLPGYYTFQPALQELQIEKRKPLSTSGQAEQSGNSQVKPQTATSSLETKPSDQQR